MIITLEKFISEKFNQMPLPVRVFTYMFILFLFAYLLLVPRFINGELVYKTESGGTIPYRGGDIQMYVEGRMLKFKANEDGCWSVPIVSRIPKSISIKFHHVDANAWYPVKFNPQDFWLDNSFIVEVVDNPPQVSLLAANKQLPSISSMLAKLGQIFMKQTSTAIAGELGLPPGLNHEAGNRNRERDHIHHEIIKFVSNYTGKDLAEITKDFRISSGSGLKYIQRIQRVLDVEKKFQLKIPDEHWNYINTVAELVDYIFKRRIIENSDKYGRWEVNEGVRPPPLNGPFHPEPGHPPPADQPIFRRW